MEVGILKEMLVLSEKKSFAAAADELFITQSSLSRHIQSIEKELGTKIFFRNSRRVELTKSGEILLEYAKKAVSLENEYKTLIDEEKRHVRLEQLKNEDWLLQEEREYLYRAAGECFRRNGFIPRLSNNNSKGVDALELVEMGMGICIEQHLIAEEKANTSVALVPISPAENIWINMLYKNIPLPQAAKDFISYMKKNDCR